jgi:hypothetical protein
VPIESTWSLYDETGKLLGVSKQQSQAISYNGIDQAKRQAAVKLTKSGDLSLIVVSGK